MYVCGEINLIFIMNTIKELIKRLEKEDQDAIVLVNGYEYGLEYLRFSNIKKGKFKLPKDSDLDSYGGTIEPNKTGNMNYLLIGRST